MSMNAQLQQGNWMVGGQLADFRFTNGFAMSLTPQVGYFIQDRWAVGAKVGFGLQSYEDIDGSDVDYSVTAFSRYYFADSEVETLLNNGAFFVEGNVGFGGTDALDGSTTNGFDFLVGAGYSYFVTNTVGLEAMLGYGGLLGGGNESFQGDLSLGVGFQIYLPNSAAKKALKDEQ